MAMTMKVDGIEKVSRMLTALGDQAEAVAALSLYDGAGVMADAYSQAVESIHAEKFRYAFGNVKRYPSFEEKAALQGKTGIAKFDKNGTEVNTAVGIKGAGYADIAGKPVAVNKIANAINSGTSFMVKQPVFRQAVSKARGPASAAIVSKAEQLIHTITAGDVTAEQFGRYFPKR